MLKNRGKRLVSALALTIALLGSATGCGAEKFETPQDEKVIQAEQQAEKEAKEKAEKEKVAKEKTEKEQDECFDVDSEQDSDVDYSKYEEKKSSGEGENATNQGKYHTDPIPEGKPVPVEPEDVTVDTSKSGTCYLQIICRTIYDNLEDLTPGKEVLLPGNGVILPQTDVTFYEGESVFDVLQRETRNRRIHMEASFTPKYNSAYVEGIYNLYEFDCGQYSGWMYEVNGWYPNYGCSRYQVKEGDLISWNYTCDLGRDLGQTWVE